MVSRSPGPVDLFELSLESARFSEITGDDPFVDYFRALFSGRRLDLVVSIGGPATRFAQRERPHLFPAAFKLSDTQAAKITRRVLGRARFFRRALSLVTAK